VTLTLPCPVRRKLLYPLSCRHSLRPRHLEGYQGVYFCVLDRKLCLHAINLDIRHISLNQPLAILYTDDSTYAKYLLATPKCFGSSLVPRLSELKNSKDEARHRLKGISLIHSPQHHRPFSARAGNSILSSLARSSEIAISSGDVLRRQSVRVC
jgi:hypothetical protein